MRNLKTSDLFSLSKIIKKMNIKEDIKALVKNVTGMKPEERQIAEQTMQTDLVMLLIENIGNAEKEVYKLLADISGKTVKEIEDMNIDNFINMIKEIFSQDGIGNFLSVALR
jgi:hypothetical protein